MTMEDDGNGEMEEKKEEGGGNRRHRGKSPSTFIMMEEEDQEAIIETSVLALNRTLREAGLHITRITNMFHPAFPGRMVIATRRIAALTEVGEYTGERLNSEEKQDRYTSGVNDGYMFDANNGFFIDGLDPRLSTVTRFINGTSDGSLANTASQAEGGRVYIHTTQAIDKGEELLLDYGPSYIFHNDTPHAPSSQDIHNLQALLKPLAQQGAGEGDGGKQRQETKEVSARNAKGGGCTEGDEGKSGISRLRTQTAITGCITHDPRPTPPRTPPPPPQRAPTNRQTHKSVGGHTG